MILFPFLGLLTWTLAFRRGGRGWLDSAVCSFVVFGAAVALVTEVQSAASALTPLGSAIAWTVVALLGLLVARRSNVTSHAVPETSEWPRIEELAPVVLLLALTGLVAYLAAPNSYDGLTYHLVRVERWIQQGSVQPFATWNTRQLFMPSWSEYAILQFRLLSGGDHFANLVQWLCFAAACGGAALLSRALGGGRTAAAIAAALVATLPMAVAQASGSQTDVAAACWAVAACAFGYRLLGTRQRSTDVLLCALSVGLAAGTKQTAVLFAGVALLPVIAMLASSGRHRAAGSLVGAMALAVGCIAGPQLARNVAVFGDLRGDRIWLNDVAMTATAPNQVIGNVLRNLSLHLGTPSASVNAAVAGGVAAASRALGANPDDPRTTWNTRYVAAPWTTHEESAPNPLHLLIVLAGIVVLVITKPRGIQLWFVIAIAAGLVIFCTELKWQSYNSRLHTPWFALALAWSAVWLERLSIGARRTTLTIVTLAALPGALLNYTRPLLTLPGGAITPRPSILETPRDLVYFMYEPAQARPYLDVANRIITSDCHDVGMRTWPDAWEYAVMALVRHGGDDTRFRAMGVINASARFMTNPATPCLLLQIWPNAGRPPAWASEWRLLAHWDIPGQPGIALFEPPR
jgi:hypothetical protein